MVSRILLNSLPELNCLLIVFCKNDSSIRHYPMQHCPPTVDTHVTICANPVTQGGNPYINSKVLTVGELWECVCVLGGGNFVLFGAVGKYGVCVFLGRGSSVEGVCCVFLREGPKQ
jgi:hypothetical protein